ETYEIFIRIWYQSPLRHKIFVPLVLVQSSSPCLDQIQRLAMEQQPQQRWSERRRKVPLSRSPLMCDCLGTTSFVGLRQSACTFEDEGKSATLLARLR
ncbi:hypothetical protein LINGRAHAP2_LOCUS3747, partial [Linum grandiflorum]